jgi:hypothetical protein
MSTKNKGEQKRSTEPSYGINPDTEDDEQGSSRNDNRYSFATEGMANFKNKPSNEISLDSDDELMFDKDAIANNSKKDSAVYLSQRNRKTGDGVPIDEKIFNLLDEENELAILDLLRSTFVDLTQILDSRGYTVLHIVAYKGLESMCKMLIQIAKDK